MKKAVFGMTAALMALTLAVPAFTSAHASTNAVMHAPRIAAKTGKLSPMASSYGWSSTNWSGYAKTGSGFSDITGEWKVTAVSSTSSATYSSSWIGIDGFNNSNLIQTGTEADYYSGSAHYGAWWEILPAAETVIPSITVHPGDTMYAHIHNNGGGVWNIYLQDVTTGVSYSTNQSYSGAATSAEWIQEAPTVGGKVAGLAHYGTVTFDPGTLNGGNPGLNTSMAGYMTNSGGTTISNVSNPDSDTDGFAAAYGSTAPSAPAS